MGDKLYDLEETLRSKQGSLTSVEADMLMRFKSMALKDFTIGAGVGAGVVWLATQSLTRVMRINLSAGAGVYAGLWKLDRTVDSFVDHILSLDGSRMQRELAKIMLKNQGGPRTMKLLSKHFYPENVFDDSSSDKAKLRWRFRNFYSDNAAHPQRTNDDSDSSSEKTTTPAKVDEKLKQQLQMKYSNIETMENPLDCVFGDPANVEEIIHPNMTSSAIPSRRHARRHKRSQRRQHRMQQQEGLPSNSEHGDESD